MPLTPASSPAPKPAPQETVQALYDAFAAGDLLALVQLLTQDVRWQFVGSPGMAYNATARGPAEVSRWFDQVFSAEHIEQFEPLEFFEGPGHVTVVGRERARDRLTGRHFETPWIHVWQVRVDASGEGRIAAFLGIYDTAAVHGARQGDLSR